MIGEERSASTATLSTIWTLLKDSAGRHGGRPAILAPDRRPLMYGDLSELVERTAGHLRALGLGREAPVAVVLPNGPDMATAFVAVSASCACAPLNPAFTRADFEFYLHHLGARALLVDEDSRTAAIAAAESLGLRILRLRTRSQAGDFELLHTIPPFPPDWPGEAHIALLLHTSGTTSTPKLVALSSRNLAASARHIAQTLALGPDDRCLNIMPLFHIHGLMAAVLASLGAGASVVCTNGGYAGRFFTWMRDFRPTWYTAVPTMHQGILARAADHPDVVLDVPLRFIRSSSAPLSPSVLAALEETFRAPVVEAYGMTEAAHQIASNPLRSGPRKPGSVGLPAGPDIAIMAVSGELLPSGSTGEVVIRGPNVASGYQANDAANAEALRDGWFRTGDLGSIDEDGYLRLTGRLKEIINRGGEKISPREVDEVLLGHPGVRQAVSFAIPHAQLGEEIGAAVELEPGTNLEASELRAWARTRLPAFKVPRIIRVVDEIHRGPTGKLQRADLAVRLGIEPLDDSGLQAVFVPPRTPTEASVAAVWRSLFPRQEIGVRTRFGGLGGDSLLAVQMLAEVSDRAGFDVPHVRFVEEGTIEALAADIDARHTLEDSPLVPLQPHGARPPLYCIPGHDGLLFGLVRLAHALPPDQPVWALDLRRLGPSATVEDLATRCCDLLLAHDPNGPYRLAGLCFGGVVATALTRHLESRGRRVESVALIDSLNPAWRRPLPRSAAASARLAQLREKARYHTARLRTMSAASRLRYLSSRAAAFLQNHAESAGALLGLSSHRTHNRRIAGRHTPQPVAASALVIRVRGRRPHASGLGWRNVFAGGVTTIDIPFDPHGSLTEGNVSRVAAALSHASHSSAGR
jgi:acyl-CoA synthetase (AMP-forming)/AMP-acid ligase II/thioesterase domain-containing protein